jgi:hypothetical protein
MAIAPDLATAFGLSNLLTRGDGTAGPRTPMEFTCSTWRSQNMPSILLMVNPHSVSFRQPKRITKKNTQGGTVFFHWTDLNGQNNDILEIQFKGRTGNIRNKPNFQPNNTFIGKGLQIAANAISGITPDTPTPNAGFAKHVLWTRLYTLTRVPMVDPTTKIRNVAEITYISPLFPRKILFMGFFNNVLEFAEIAEQPWLVEWSFSFIVQATNPGLDSVSQMLMAVLNSQITGTAQTGQENTQLQDQATSNAVTGAPFQQG